MRQAQQRYQGGGQHKPQERLHQPLPNRPHQDVLPCALSPVSTGQEEGRMDWCRFAGSELALESPLRRYSNGRVDTACRYLS